MSKQLREFVAFDRPSGTADSFGGKSVTWAAVHTCHAEFIYAGGDEGVQAARQAGRQSFKIKVRSCVAARSITTDYRMRDVRRSTAYNITDVDAIIDRQWVWLRVEGPVVT
jgi:head-tail adaptor